MDASADGKLARRIASKTEQLGQLVARRLLREQRKAMRARAQARRAESQKRMAFGKAVVDSGCEQWSVSELVGVLLDARARIGASATQMLGMRKRGEAHLNGVLLHEPAPPTQH